MEGRENDAQSSAQDRGHDEDNSQKAVATSCGAKGAEDDVFLSSVSINGEV